MLIDWQPINGLVLVINPKATIKKQLSSEEIDRTIKMSSRLCEKRSKCGQEVVSMN
jgi:hypothetical protein